MPWTISYSLPSLLQLNITFSIKESAALSVSFKANHLKLTGLSELVTYSLMPCSLVGACQTDSKARMGTVPLCI